MGKFSYLILWFGVRRTMKIYLSICAWKFLFLLFFEILRDKTFIIFDKQGTIGFKMLIFMWYVLFFLVKISFLGPSSYFGQKGSMGQNILKLKIKARSCTQSNLNSNIQHTLVQKVGYHELQCKINSLTITNSYENQSTILGVNRYGFE